MPVIAIHVTEQRTFVVLRVTVVVAVMTMRMEVMRVEVMRVRVHVTMMPLVVMMPTVVGVS